MHATLIAIENNGILILGEPGSGKSRLAHALIEKGHQLVADDLVEIHTQEDGSALGQAPKKLAGLLHLRHLGLFDIREQYGSEAYCQTAPIHFAVTLDPNLVLPPATLALPLETLELCQLKIPMITLNLSNETRPAAIFKLLVGQHFAKIEVPNSTKRNIIRAINS